MITTRKVIEDDALLLFHWANDEETRRNSFESKPIEWKDHLEWLEQRLFETSSFFYLCLYEQKPAGFVRIESKERENHAVVGIVVAPEVRGKGLAGDMIMQCCLEFFREKQVPVYAYIKETNIASIKSFYKAGFENYKTNEVINGAKSVILKLNYNVD